MPLASASRRKRSKLANSALRSPSRSSVTPLSTMSALPSPSGLNGAWATPRKPGWPLSAHSMCPIFGDRPTNGRHRPDAPGPCSFESTEPSAGQPPGGCWPLRRWPVRHSKASCAPLAPTIERIGTNLSIIAAIRGKCSQISMPGTLVLIGLNSPRISAGRVHLQIEEVLMRRPARQEDHDDRLVRLADAARPLRPAESAAARARPGPVRRSSRTTAAKVRRKSRFAACPESSTWRDSPGGMHDRTPCSLRTATRTTRSYQNIFIGSSALCALLAWRPLTCKRRTISGGVSPWGFV